MNIIRMAQQCGDWNGQTIEMNDVGLERFAALVAAAERDRCILMLERLYERSGEQYKQYLHAAKVLKGDV